MTGKLLYGLLFVAVIPALLVAWAVATAPVVPLPAVPFPWIGGLFAALGLAAMLAGMGALMIHGRGLPMNPYPPPVYVTRGIYRFLRHPIYAGFVATCFGVAIAFESPSGTWLVSPLVALSLTALVVGYERHDLRRRFGAETLHRPLLSLPPNSEQRPSGWNRLSLYLLVLLPWALAFEAIVHLGVPDDAVEAYFPFERAWPVLEWTEAIYGSVYLFVLSAPLLAPRQRDLRRLAVMGWIATVGVMLVYLTVPVIAPPRPFEPQTMLGRLLMVERSMGHTVAAFPAFHVIWSLLAADAWARRSPAWAAAGWTWAALIAVSCCTTGMHALADVIAGALVFVLVSRYRRLWAAMRRATEALANSWREWRWGGVRFINHGLYAGLGAAVGFWISASLGGPRLFWPLLLVYLCGLLGAGLWAQKLEGSSKLSRPFGYFGSVLGASAGAILLGAVTGDDTLRLLALIAVAAPWIQAIGRLRCLVQGCCHGAEAPEGIGIRYRQPRSRVCVLGHLEGVALHPTPLYSILANIVIGVLLLRAWSLEASYALIGGLYLMLSGVARFLEESYRGEPQTAVIGGLRLYQWLAALSFVLGAALTAIPSGHPAGLGLSTDPSVWIGGLLYGAFAAFAMGVDFPGSGRRFARLASP